MKKALFSVAVASAVFLGAGVYASHADVLPIKNLGHGVVCSKNACMIQFPQNVQVMKIYKYRCRPNEPLCKSALYVDLSGLYPNMPTFVVEDSDLSDFFYKGVIASHSDGKGESTRRFVLEFKTRKLPVVAWDFNTGTLEVINTEKNFKISKPIAHKKPQRISKHKPTTVKRKSVLTNPPVVLVKKVSQEQKQQAQSNKTAEKPEVVVEKKPKISAVAVRKTQQKAPVQSANNSNMVEKKNGKYVLNMNKLQVAKVKSQKQKTGKKKTEFKQARVLSFEQMGDMEFRQGNYNQAIFWYEKALRSATNRQDVKRIADKVIAAIQAQKETKYGLQ